jgi:hypothetical protein
MAPKFIPFEDVEALADILQLSRMLNLEIKASGAQFRCACPVHGGDHRTLCISPQVKSRRGSLGCFYCQADKSGGDRIGLVAHCMEMGQQDAAFFIASQFGLDLANSSTVTSTGTVPTLSKDRATAPPAREKTDGRTQPAFDPAAFAAKLVFTEEVAALGFTEADAERFQIGHYRGKTYFPIRHQDGSISGFVGYSAEGLKLPPRWLEPPAPNVVAFPKRA